MFRIENLKRGCEFPVAYDSLNKQHGDDADFDDDKPGTCAGIVITFHL